MRPRRAVLAVVCCVVQIAFGVQACLAGSSIDRIEPPGGTPGTEIEVRITGSDLAAPAELFFESGKIRVLSLEPEGDKVVKAKLQIPADCPLGGHRMRVRTADGLSELRIFQVHPFEQRQEVEPNDDAEKAMPVELGKTVWGTIRSEEVDLFKVTAKAGDRISAVIDAVRLEQQMLDAHLELVDEEGFVLAACDDHPLLSQDPMISTTVPKDGDYFLRVRESAYGGGSSLYMLHVGNFPIPHAAWPPGGREGVPFEAELFGDPAGPFKQKVTLPKPGLDGLARIRPVRDGKTSPLTVPFRVSSAPLVTEQEPNDATEAAAAGKGPVAKAPVAIAGRMDASEDVDWIRVEAPSGSKWKVSCWGRRLGSPIDLVVAAHRDDKAKGRLTSNDDTDGPDSLLQVTVPAEGAFLLRVSDFERRGGPEFIYWIDVEPVVPAVAVSVSPATTRTQERLVVAVPKGNRSAIFFNAARTDCQDPLRIEFDGLPADVTAKTAAFSEPAPGGLVVFEAGKDAAPATSLADVKVIRGEGDKAERVGSLRQSTDLVFGEPNRTTYRSVLGDRLAVAVVDEAPVSIELVEPATPVVRGGIADLVVKVRRSEDFEGRVRLDLPFKPAGVGSAFVDVDWQKVGGTETEAKFPISIARDASTRDWQIAVTATLLPSDGTMKDAKKDDKKDKKPAARVTGRAVMVASAPVKLQVAEPLVELVAEKAVVEQGGETKITFKVTRNGSFEGKAKATLVGLPTKTETQPLELAEAGESLEFAVKTGADAPAGKHDPIICRLEVPMNGGWIIHQSQPTSLRIDKPLRSVAQSNPAEPAKP